MLLTAAFPVSFSMRLERLTCILEGEGSGTLGKNRDEEKRKGELSGSQRLQTCHEDKVPLLCYDDRKPNGI